MKTLRQSTTERANKTRIWSAALAATAIAFFVAAISLGAGASRAEQPLFKKTVLLENQAVQSYELYYKPGGTATITHTYPARVIYIVQGGVMEITPKGGETKRTTLKPGDIIWRRAGSLHLKNVGDTDIKVIEVELKHLSSDVN